MRKTVKIWCILPDMFTVNQKILSLYYYHELMGEKNT